jgi:predicted dienelactone hydrolase
MKKYGFLLLVILVSLTLPLSAQDESPVTQTGPYQVGIEIMRLVDESREDRRLKVYIWYPAVLEAGAESPYPPDTSGAPYPLIIYSHGHGGAATEIVTALQRLASHGFVVAAPEHPDGNDGWLPLVDRPLDIMFLLNQLAELQDNPLTGVMDTDNVGVMGFSFGGFTTVIAGGARVDMDYYADWCAINKLAFSDYCGTSADWDRLQAYYVTRHPDQSPDDGFWAATTDDRIHALLLIAPCFGQMFSPAGLASITMPEFIIGGTRDLTCPYRYDALYFYDNLTVSDRYLVSLDQRNHAGVFNSDDLIKQYATAFFGYYLQGKIDYADYMTPESAEAFRSVTLEAHHEEAGS